MLLCATLNPMNETLENTVSNEVETQPEQSETFFNSLVGIGEAAHITGRSKGQIGRDANSGRLPHTLNEKKEKRYRVSDLDMIYKLKNPDAKKNETGSKIETTKETVSQSAVRPTEIPNETAIELALLRQQVQHKDEIIRRTEQENRELKQLRDNLMDQTSRLTLLLPAPAATSFTNETPERLPWWKRLFG